MIWLQTPPWGRWLLATAILLVGAWVELRPEPTVPHPFATEDIARGELIGAANSRQRPVPVGMLDPVPRGAVAARDINAGAPILPADTDPAVGAVPAGWWTVSLPVPGGSRVGDRVLVVVIETGRAVEGVVTAVADSDPFTGGSGGVAVPADHAGAVAKAALDGRLAVMVSTG